ncbi:hypothetical protein ACFQ14_00035 [Pseudahrensia aquimaris]|uniref:Transposase n=1 Tax=Pseudahrensia aquimaris TaxID=744461 RepID=A0ABW3FAQ2_9HYPH
MRLNAERHKDASERTVKHFQRKTRKRYAAKEKICIVLAGLRGKGGISDLCRHEGVSQGIFYARPRGGLEAGKSSRR